MSDLVPADRIEEIVGARRHPTLHLALADSVVERVYVLHSADCVSSVPDLRDCPYSIALDAGILHADWALFEDRPVVVAVRAEDCYLVPVAPWTSAAGAAFDFAAAALTWSRQGKALVVSWNELVDSLWRAYQVLSGIHEARMDRSREIRVSVDRRRRARRRRSRRSAR